MPPTANDIRVLVVADDPLVRSGLAALLAGVPGLAVAGQIASEADLARLEIFSPDVILWDLGWDAGRSLERLADHDDRVPVVALVPDAAHVSETWAARVRGLLPRQAQAGELAAALQAAARGFIVLTPDLAAPLLPSRSPAPALPEELTPRELEVLQLLAEGLSNKAIAGRLGISDHTVKFHINSIMGKLGAESRTDAVVRATRLGLIIL